ncbi:MAG: hypothetical protein GXP26_13570 [Planctomycetes bacterium]|nr:hypothetical protein [Planctomycetota bacterium]
MRRLPILAMLLTVATVLALATDGFAQNGNDRIQRRNGTDIGKITKITALTVTLSKRGVESTIPSEEIRSIRFAGEPTKLNSARLSAQKGQYQQALETLKKIAADKIDRKAIAQELDFLKTYCTAKLAMGGQGPLDQANSLVARFLANSRKSFHLTEVIELAGDLSAATGDYETARKNYAKLARAPSAFYKARSAVLIGGTFQAEGKHAEAIAEFDKGLQAAGDHAVASPQRTEATLLRATSQAATGEAEQSAAAVKSIIAKADAEDEPLLAQAYNALGECYLHADKKKPARDAFLHVDILFASAPNERAKALYQLSQLWPTLGHPQRAADAQQRLKDDYPSSPWANH